MRHPSVLPAHADFYVTCQLKTGVEVYCPLCRASFQPLSQKGLGDTEGGGASYLGLDGPLAPAQLGAKRLLKADSPVILKGL